MKTLLQEFEIFSSYIIPENSSFEQKVEMKKAFYAGAAIMMKNFMNLGESDLTDEKEFENLSAIEKEIINFVDAHG